MSTWTALTPVEVEELKRMVWSLGEVCYLIGISPERLLTWHKQPGLVPEPRLAKGRGNRRKYNFYQVAYLLALYTLARRGIALTDAAWWAEHVFTERITEAFTEICQAQTVEEADQQVHAFVVLYDADGQEGHEEFNFEVFFRGQPVREDQQEGPQNLEEWMREYAIPDVILVHPGQLAFNLRSMMDGILEQKVNGTWKDELRAYLQRFKRPKEKPKEPVRMMAEAFVSGLKGEPEPPRDKSRPRPKPLKEPEYAPQMRENLKSIIREASKAWAPPPREELPKPETKKTK